MTAAAALLAGLAGAATAGGFTVATAGGPVRVGAALEADTVPPAAAPRLAFRPEGEGLVGEWADARLEAAVRVAPAAGAGFEIRVEVRWRAAVEVERLALRLRLPGPARAVGRGLTAEAVEGRRRVDAGTPLWVEGGGLLLAGGPGLVGAVVAPAAGGSEVLLLLDDEAAHPFALYPSCLPRLPPPALRSWAALERRRPAARARRAPGDRDGAAAQLVPLLAGGARPLVVERWPAAARAALVLTDHADRTDPEALRALLHGASGGPRAEGTGRGLLAHGLRITKSFFARDVRGGLLDDPEAAALAAELAAAGSEVALHSPGTGPDRRDAVGAALAALRPWRMTTWIDHQPHTNCEALSSEGAGEAGPFGIRDLLVAEGFRWAWAASDARATGAPRLANLLDAAPPAEASPPVYPLPADRRLWIFRSTLFHGTPRALAEALSEEALDALEERGGLFVGHTYLCASPRSTRDPEERRRLAVRARPGGGLEIDPDLDAGLARAGRRVRAGTLASLTLREAGDRLRALAAVRVVYLPDGAARLENHGHLPVDGLALADPGAGALEAEGPGAGACAAGRGGRRAFLDLGPGEAATVRALGPAGPVPFLAADPGATLAP